jgi:exodeoxyribonuclease X
VIAVAHNANFEREMLAKAGITPHRWLCTYKAAVRVWPDCPSHSNECLRYYLGFGTGRSAHQMPHSASHDVQVTTDLLKELLRLGTPIADMLAWTLEPALLPRCPIGDWRGHTWDEVEEGFLQWILRKITDREDVRFCAQKELERREAERAKARTALREPKKTRSRSDALPAGRLQRTALRTGIAAGRGTSTARASSLQLS